MRPTIINKQIIDAFKKIVNEDMNAIIFTDEDLVVEVNNILTDENKFSYSAFKDWKAFALETKDKTDEANMAKYRELGSVIKKALVKQKKALFESMTSDDKAWQKWAWIIERKFDAWNIRQRIDQTTKVTNFDKIDTEGKNFDELVRAVSSKLSQNS